MPNKTIITNKFVPGIYYVKCILSKQHLQHINELIDRICYFDDKNNSHTIESKLKDTCTQKWYEFDPGRFTIPCLPAVIPDSLNCYTDGTILLNSIKYMESLRNFEVFGNFPPEKWLNLSTLVVSSDTDIAMYSQVLQSLQYNIVNYLLNAENSSLNMKKSCLQPCFLQFQYMERGVRIMPVNTFFSFISTVYMIS